MGGFTWSGTAWRLRIPPSSVLHGLDAANNILEYLAMVVTLWLQIKECQQPHECILALGDNTSAIGWMFRTPKIPKTSFYHKPAQLILRQLATIMLNSNQGLFGQHLRGTKNVVADLLSFTGNQRGTPHPLAPDPTLSDTTLTSLFHSYCPQLIPQHFEIRQLPPDVSSFVELVMQTTESSFMQYRNQPTDEKNKPSPNGQTSANPPALTTYSSMTYPQTNSTSSPNPSSTPAAGTHLMSQAAFLADVRSLWWKRHFELPQAIWLRRSGVTTGKVPSTSREALPHAFTHTSPAY